MTIASITPLRVPPNINQSKFQSTKGEVGSKMDFPKKTIIIFSVVAVVALFILIYFLVSIIMLGNDDSISVNLSSIGMPQVVVM